jgi:hypothetical protein
MTLRKVILSLSKYVRRLFILSSLFVYHLPAQNSPTKQFSKLSRPEKVWVFMHPFKAKKAFVITKDVLVDVDSIKMLNIIGKDNNGGKLDAFKHAYWMASIANTIGARRTRKLGIAHEKGNKIQFKKHQLEDSMLPDSMTTVMDLHNNIVGIKLVANKNNASKSDIQKWIMNALNEGQLKIIKKDKQGNFLTCDGSVIALSEWHGKWNIPKCLVSSNTE